jgi:hypothetical protein
VLLAGGLVLGVAAVAWTPVAVPRIVKLPTDIDRTDHYTGNLVTFIDRTTGTALATPSVVPLTIDRHIAGVEGESGAHVALLKETVTAHMGGQDVVQENVYAVDRRTMENVADPRAYTFTPDNVIDRSGTHYLTLPMSLDSKGEALSIWKPEAGASYPLVSTTPATGIEAGTKAVYLHGEIPTPLPAPAYELAILRARGLPMQLTPEQASAQLTAAGVDVAAVAPVLIANLDAAELKAVTDVLALPMPLKYSVYGHGLLGAEPKTGGLVTLTGIVDGISVKPDLSGMAPAIAALRQHADVPAIASLMAILDKMGAAPPQPVYEMQYTQTPASVADAASYARSQADKVVLATRTLPVGMAVVAAMFVLGGSALVWFPRRRHSKTADVTEVAIAEKSAA